MWVHDEELTSSDFFFRTTDFIDNEGVAEATDLAYPGREWPAYGEVAGRRVDNWTLAPGETKHLEGRLKLKSGDEYQGAELRACVYMTDMDDPGEYRVIQRRLLQVKNVPEFTPRKPCDVVIVCSLATSRELYKGWRHMLEKEMGLRVDTFGMTRYGSFEPSQATTVGHDARLRDYIASAQSGGSLVVVLDQSFEHPMLPEGTGGQMHAGVCLSPWHLRACPERSDKVAPPAYLLVHRLAEFASTAHLGDRYNGDIGAKDGACESAKWGGEGDEQYKDVPSGDLPNVMTGCCRAQTISEAAGELFAAVRGVFSSKASQEFETFTGGDGSVRTDESRPFNHLTRWEVGSDPYGRYAEMHVDYKLNCCTSTFLCCCCCCNCNPHSWAERVCDRVAVEVAGKIEAAGLDGTITVNILGEDGAPYDSAFEIPDGATRIGRLRVYVQPRRRVHVSQSFMPMAGWQEEDGQEGAAAGSLPNRYLVAVSMPPGLKVRCWAKALAKLAKTPDDEQAALTSHALGHALCAGVAEELITLAERKSVEVEETADFLSVHLPTLHALACADEGIDLSPANGSQLAKVMASELAGIGSGEHLGMLDHASAAAKVVRFGADEFAKRFEVGAGDVQTEAMARVAACMPDGFVEQDDNEDLVHGFLQLLDSTGLGHWLHGRGNKSKASRSLEAYRRAFGPESYEQLALSDWSPVASIAADMLGARGFVPQHVSRDAYAEPPVAIRMERDLELDRDEGSYVAPRLFAAALKTQRTSLSLGGVSDQMVKAKAAKLALAARRASLARGEDPDAVPEEEEEKLSDGIEVRPPVFPGGYMSQHVRPFPPTVPGEPIPFLPAAPYDGDNTEQAVPEEAPEMVVVQGVEVDGYGSEGSGDETYQMNYATSTTTTTVTTVTTTVQPLGNMGILPMGMPALTPEQLAQHQMMLAQQQQRYMMGGGAIAVDVDGDGVADGMMVMQPVDTNGDGVADTVQQVMVPSGQGMDRV